MISPAARDHADTILLISRIVGLTGSPAGVDGVTVPIVSTTVRLIVCPQPVVVALVVEQAN